MKYVKFILCFVAIAIVANGCSSNGEGKSSGNQSAMTYQEACNDLDFEKARECLNDIHQNYITEQSKDGILHRDERKEAEKKYYEAFDYIYKAEIQYLLSEYDEAECVDKITFLMEEIPVEGEKAPAGLCDYSLACRGDWGDDGIPLDAYIVWTEHYNRLCNTILTLSINRNYSKLAKVALTFFVDNVEAHKGGRDNVGVDGVIVDGNHGYIKYTSTDRDAAKKKYDEAVQLGLTEQ